MLHLTLFVLWEMSHCVMYEAERKHKVEAGNMHTVFRLVREKSNNWIAYQDEY